MLIGESQFWGYPFYAGSVCPTSRNTVKAPVNNGWLFRRRLSSADGKWRRGYKGPHSRVTRCRGQLRRRARATTGRRIFTRTPRVTATCRPGRPAGRPGRHAPAHTITHGRRAVPCTCFREVSTVFRESGLPLRRHSRPAAGRSLPFFLPRARHAIAGVAKRFGGAGSSMNRLRTHRTGPPARRFRTGTAVPPRKAARASGTREYGRTGEGAGRGRAEPVGPHGERGARKRTRRTWWSPDRPGPACPIGAVARAGRREPDHLSHRSTPTPPGGHAPCPRTARAKDLVDRSPPRRRRRRPCHAASGRKCHGRPEVRGPTAPGGEDGKALDRPGPGRHDPDS